MTCKLEHCICNRAGWYRLLGHKSQQPATKTGAMTMKIDAWNTIVRCEYCDKPAKRTIGAPMMKINVCYDHVTQAEQECFRAMAHAHPKG